MKLERNQNIIVSKDIKLTFKLNHSKVQKFNNEIRLVVVYTFFVASDKFSVSVITKTCLSTNKDGNFLWLLLNLEKKFLKCYPLPKLNQDF